MACKCNKDKFRQEFLEWVENAKREASSTYYNVTAYYYYKAGLNDAKNKFGELWQEHMEEDDE